ncbi:hypothetical protein [Streptomyces auratus]|uniref:Uncharacterized protein n=1 Tax=Streptomyces auratus AGR0001 TaxID=1160718 RepID=J2K198_9ACTN|nr:hypothetical protein [Streptomyces auratus]
MRITRRLVTKVTVTLHAITAVTMHVIRTFPVHVITVVAWVTTRVLMAVRVGVIACHTAYRGTASRLQLLP